MWFGLPLNLVLLMAFRSPLGPFPYCPDDVIGLGPEGFRGWPPGEFRRAATGDYSASVRECDPG